MSQQVSMKYIFGRASASNKKLLSVELYSHLEVDLELCKVLNPSFYSLTWAHGDLSNVDALPGVAVARKLQESSINMLMHVCGRNLGRDNALAVMNRIKSMGIKNVLALKGGSNIIEPDDSKCEYPYGLEFIRFLAQEFGGSFCFGTSGYPIGHPSSADPVKDIRYLKKKVDAGADFVICQGVFDLQTFKEFYKRCREQGINVPIIPSVYAINSYQVLQSLMDFCKIVPANYLNTMEKYQNDDEAITKYSIIFVSDLIRSLLKDPNISIPGVHVFCFNNLSLVKEVFSKLDFIDLKIWQPQRNENISTNAKTL